MDAPFQFNSETGEIKEIKTWYFKDLPNYCYLPDTPFKEFGGVNLNETVVIYGSECIDEAHWNIQEWIITERAKELDAELKYINYPSEIEKNKYFRVVFLAKV